MKIDEITLNPASINNKKVDATETGILNTLDDIQKVINLMNGLSRSSGVKDLFTKKEFAVIEDFLKMTDIIKFATIKKYIDDKGNMDWAEYHKNHARFK